MHRTEVGRVQPLPISNLPQEKRAEKGPGFAIDWDVDKDESRCTAGRRRVLVAVYSGGQQSSGCGGRGAECHLEKG